VSVNDLYTASGLGTKELLWEVAAGAMVGAVCGLHQHGVGATAGNEKNHTSGLEARFQAEVAYAALGHGRAEINEWILECLSHYEQSLSNPNLGKPFPEVYNIDSLEPNEKWLDSYQQVRESLKAMKLDMDNAWRNKRHD